MNYWDNRRDISELIGKTLVKIEQSEDELIIYCDDETIYKMYHEQDCCESVTIEDICGDINDLIGFPIIMTEEVTSQENPRSEWTESFTWTFYKLATNKGYVTIRWYGESNGYYSESVEFARV